MTAAEILHALGGVARWAELERRAGEVEVARAVRAGEVARDARGRYALPGVDAATRRASMLTAVLSHRSAAAAHGWAQKSPPDRPELTVARNRRLTAEQRRGVTLHRADLTVDEVVGVVTSHERTMVDCLRALPPDEALAIADSALREESFTPASLHRLAEGMRGPGCVRARAIVERADGLAANPFESVLRHLAWEAGLDVRPQVPLFADEFLGQPDLVDIGRRLVLEADSFAWHGDRAALDRDAKRYNRFVAQGWLVLRFSWEEVMLRPAQVLVLLGGFTQERTHCLFCRRSSA